MEYFNTYQETFAYNENKNFYENFKALKALKKWKSDEEDEEWQTLNLFLIENELPKFEEYSEREFFDYFVKNFNFKPKFHTVGEKFVELAELMKWDEKTQDEVEEYICYDCETFKNCYDYYYHVQDNHFHKLNEMKDLKYYFLVVFDFENEDGDERDYFLNLLDHLGLKYEKDAYDITLLARYYFYLEQEFHKQNLEDESFKEYFEDVFGFENVGEERDYFINLIEYLGLKNIRDRKAISLLAHFYYLSEKDFHTQNLGKQYIFDYFSEVFGLKPRSSNNLRNFNNIIKFLGLDKDETHKAEITSLRRNYCYSRLDDYEANLDPSDFFGYFKEHFEFKEDADNKKKSLSNLIKFLGLKTSNEEDNEIIANFTDHFYNYINECVESTFNDENIENLHDIVKNYNLRSGADIPLTMKDCIELIKSELFANIFDYAAKNYKKFHRLNDLVDYSVDEHKVYPLERAKEKFVYKVLLKEFFF
jgi:hypothetical protein